MDFAGLPIPTHEAGIRLDEIRSRLNSSELEIAIVNFCGLRRAEHRRVLSLQINLPRLSGAGVRNPPPDAEHADLPQTDFEVANLGSGRQMQRCRAGYRAGVGVVG